MFAYDWDAATDKVVLSGECAHILGVDERNETTAHDMFTRVHPEDQEKLTTAFAGLTPQKSHSQLSYRIIHPQRGVVWVETNSNAYFDGGGRIRRIAGTVTDITARSQAELEQALTNDWVQLAMEAGKTVGWDWDVRSGRDSWFGDLETIFGLPSKTYIGHVEDFRRHVHPEDRAIVWTAVKEAMQDRKAYVAEFRIVRLDGEVRWVEAQGKFYYSSKGEPRRMLGIAVDITERKAAQEALLRKESELSQARRLAGVGSWRWHPDSDTVAWSDELYRIFGRDPKQPLADFRDHSALFTADSRERLQLAVAETLRTGVPYQIELEIVRADGSRRWLIDRAETQRDANDRVVRLNGMVIDITERKRSQEALRENEERLRLAAQAGRMYAYEWDRATDVITRSAEYTHILGLTTQPAAMTCQQMLATVHPDDRSKVVGATEGCTPENPGCHVKYRVLRPDGSVIWLQKHAHAFFDRTGKMYRMIGMVADITEHKLTEEALSSVSRRLIEAQDTERARIARDLHDDVGQRLALLSVTLEQVRQAAGELTPVRSRLDELRKQILDISASVHNLSHELHSTTLQYLNVGRAIRGLCTEVSEQQKVEIDFYQAEVPKKVPQEISRCLFRVLQEALHNAVKHSNVRHFQVGLQGTSDAIHLTIRDSGMGFEPDAARNGPGLGLTSMQERLRLVNGDLFIDSSPGHGTTIHARVPLDTVGV
jgi:PAS domain S-box-containing protein